MKLDSDARLPRSPKAPDELVRLREEALRRLEREERASRFPEERASAFPSDEEPAPEHIQAATVYGGPPPRDDRPDPRHDEPAPVYGGPPPFGGGGPVTRRKTLWGLLVLALGVIGGIIAWFFRGCSSARSQAAQSGPPAAVYGGPPIPPPQPPPAPINPGPTPQTFTSAIRTHNGSLLTAGFGRGLGDAKSALHGVALTTGAITVGPFETFTFIWVDKAARTFALETHDGHFVSVAKGGGMGESDSDQFPIRADATTAGRWGTFTITLLPDNIHATIRTPDNKHYLSAVNGGGVGGSDAVPIHTDATKMVPEAVFQLVSGLPVSPNPGPSLRRPQAPVYGGPPPKPGT